MDWFEITTSDGKKELINANTIMRVSYNNETNLTIIEFNRAAYGAVYMRGNYINDIKRLLSAHDNYVSRIGE